MTLTKKQKIGLSVAVVIVCIGIGIVIWGALTNWWGGKFAKKCTPEQLEILNAESGTIKDSNCAVSNCLDGYTLTANVCVLNSSSGGDGDIPKDYICGGTNDDSNTCPTGKLCKIPVSDDEINTCIEDKEYTKNQQLINNSCLALYGTKSGKGIAHDLSDLTNTDSETRYSACISNTSCNIYTTSATDCIGGNDKWWRCDSATPVDGKTQIDVMGRDLDLVHCNPELLNAEGACDCTAPGPTGYAAPTCKPQLLDKTAIKAQGGYEGSRLSTDEGFSDFLDYVRSQSSCFKHKTMGACAGEDGDYRGNPGQSPNTCAWYPKN